MMHGPMNIKKNTKYSQASLLKKLEVTRNLDTCVFVKSIISNREILKVIYSSTYSQQVFRMTIPVFRTTFYATPLEDMLHFTR